MKTAILILAVLFTGAITSAEEFVVREYRVKGMTCSGCVFGVKKALERAGIPKDRIIDVDFRTPDPTNSVGHAKVAFKRSEYQGTETDCRLVKAIKAALGYIAYWDLSETNPCHL